MLVRQNNCFTSVWESRDLDVSDSRFEKGCVSQQHYASFSATSQTRSEIGTGFKDSCTLTPIVLEKDPRVAN